MAGVTGRGHERGRWTIGFVAPAVHGYFWGNVFAGVLQAAAARGGRVMAIQTFDADLMKFPDEYFTAPLGWQHIDALVASQSSASDEYLQAFARTGKPVLTIYREPEGLRCPIVVPDNRSGIHLAVDHLIEHGHTEIGFVGRNPAQADEELRYRAYEEVMRARGLRPREPAVVSWQFDDSYDATAAARQLRRQRPMPTAVVAGTDLAAMALIDELAGAGISVPDDLAVIGFDDIADAATFSTPLSTVSQSFLLTGATACGLAFDALEGTAVEPGLHFTPVTLICRRSCGCPGAAAAETEPAPSDTGTALTQFVDKLAEAAHDVRELAGSERRELTSVAERLASLLTMVARAPGTDITEALEATTRDLRQLVAESPNPLQVVSVVRQFSQAYRARLAPDDHEVAVRVERLVFDLAFQLLENRYLDVRGRPVAYHDMEIQRRYFMIGTDLVRQRGLSAESLDWLADTEFCAGCLALWETGRGNQGGGERLRVVSTYDPTGRFAMPPEPCEVSAFPPASFVEFVDHHADHCTGHRRERSEGGDLGYVYLLPLRFGGSNWGYLALAGSLDPREEAAFERYNHWAVLMTVALDQEQALHSERALLEEIKVSEERYALAAEAANDGLWDWNLASGTVYYSGRWKALLGCSDDEVPATPGAWLDRVHDDDRPSVNEMLARHFERRASTTRVEYRLRVAGGEYRWMLTHGRSMHDDGGRVVRLIGSMTDITDRKLLEQRLRHDAQYDQLTGLPNRTLFLDRLEQAIGRADRHAESLFAVVFLDLDGFKVINDSLGHQIGDEVLTLVAERLTGQLRRQDTVARFGGDEFVLLLGDFLDVGDLQGTVARILSAVSAPMLIGGRTLAVTSAAGIAVSSNGHHTADEYLRDADTAMYRAKAAGNGSLVLFDQSMHAGAVKRLQLESDLRQAIVVGQFELYYQPIVRLRDRRTIGTEALIRWHHPEQGVIVPDDFLPVAEATGLTRDIGRWTVETACRDVGGWLDRYPEHRRQTVSINLSNRQFWDPELRRYLHRALADTGVPPSMIVFEVTEGVIMRNQDAASGLMRQLHEDGYKLHIDDFGTGYSSLAALHRFPVDALKIDRSFVARMNTDTRSRKLVRLMIAMGLDLDIQVIAEGVESERQAAVLAELGCPFAQGYLFAEPVPAAGVPRYLADAGPLLDTAA